MFASDLMPVRASNFITCVLAHNKTRMPNTLCVSVRVLNSTARSTAQPIRLHTCAYSTNMNIRRYRHTRTHMIPAIIITITTLSRASRTLAHTSIRTHLGGRAATRILRECWRLSVCVRVCVLFGFVQMFFWLFCFGETAVAAAEFCIWVCSSFGLSIALWFEHNRFNLLISLPVFGPDLLCTLHYVY